MIEIQKNNILLNINNYINNLIIPLEKYYYHNYEHTIDVMNRAIYLWKKEWLNNEEIEILAIAWLFHDTWYIIEYDENEKYWAKIAENYLKYIKYPNEKIEKIKNIILATSIKYENPKNIMEKIIKDSDMDVLWRDDFIKKSLELKKELEIIKKIEIKDIDWFYSTLNLFKTHSFLTNTQINERNYKKFENQKLLENMIKNHKS